MQNYSDTSGGMDTDTAEVILAVVVVVVVLWAVASLRCWYATGDGDGGGQQQGETADKDGNMVVLDGAQLAISVADQVQPSCCCGGGSDGDGGSCGGCGGD